MALHAVRAGRWSLFVVVAIALAIPCATIIILLDMVFRFSRMMVGKTNGDTKSLRDVAVLLRAFRDGPVT